MTTTRAELPALAARARSVAASPVREILALTARPEVISFAGGLPAPELFDAEAIRAAYDRVLAEQSGRVLQYSTTEGDPALRAAVAGRLTARGLATEADDLLVTGGSQQGLTLVATALLEPGDVVLVENPTYLAALQTFAFAGARVVPVPTDADGLVPEALAELVLRERPKLLYLVPNFQNPTGRTLPLARRRAVAEVAGRHGLWIAEDDPYGELRFEGRSEPWIAALEEAADRAGARLRCRQAGRRPAHLHRRPGGGGPLSRGQRPGRASDPGAYRLPGPARRAAGRPPRRAARGQRLEPARGRDVRVGPPARRPRRHRTPADRDRIRRRLRAGCPLLRRLARRGDAADVVHDAHPRGDHR